MVINERVKGSQFLSDPDVSNIRVAVVGNATSILDSGHGRQIDACDVVIRMNLGVPISPSNQGKRTTVLAFSSYQLVRNLAQDFGCPSLFWMSPNEREKYTGSPEMHFYDLDRWENLRKELGARPSVGAMLLDYLDGKGVQLAELFGFDFKETSTFYLRKPHRGPHSFEAERERTKMLCDRNGWIFHGTIGGGQI